MIILISFACNGAVASRCAQGVNCLPWQPLLQLDPYIIDTLLVGRDRHPSAFIVYLHLWRAAHGNSRERTQIALEDIAELTGLSKRSVQSAVGWLMKRKLISVERRSITAIPVYTVLRPWWR